MSKRCLRRLARGLGLLAIVTSAGTAGCDDTPTTAVVANDYAPADPAMTVYKVWWVTTLFDLPVSPGGLSPTERTVPTTGPAYALLAPGWSARSDALPARLIALQSSRDLAIGSGERLRIGVSAVTFDGDCAAGRPLPASSAQLIVERIFPGAFAGKSYDPATCTTTELQDAGPPDGGLDDGSSPDAGTD